MQVIVDCPHCKMPFHYIPERHESAWREHDAGIIKMLEGKLGLLKKEHQLGLQLLFETLPSGSVLRNEYGTIEQRVIGSHLIVKYTVEGGCAYALE